MAHSERGKNEQSITGVKSESKTKKNRDNTRTNEFISITLAPAHILSDMLISINLSEQMTLVSLSAVSIGKVRRSQTTIV